eukprot:m.182654 g.182654  ORF g.182654 m.182654 type:complete len:674 (-) comp14980_c0_seq1:5339-7360(-)
MGCCTHKDLDFVAPGGRKRRCTDIIFLGLFIVFLIGLFYTISWSLQYGEPNRLLYGADSYGNICGENNKIRIDSTNSGLDMTDRKHQYYTGLDNGDGNTLIVCARSCPTVEVDCNTHLATCQELGVCLSGNVNFTSPYTVPPTGSDNGSPAGSGCPATAVKSLQSGLLQRCIPDQVGAVGASRDAVNAFADGVNKNSYVNDIFESFSAAREPVLYMLLIACALSYVIISIMKYFVKPLVWGCIFGMIAVLVYMAWYLFDRHKVADDAIKEDEAQNVPVTDDEKRERDFYYYSSIFFLIFAIVMIVITIFLRTDIRKSIDLYKEASEAIRAMPSMFIAPFLTYLWLLATAVFFIVTGAYLVTTEKHVNDLYENSTTFGHIKYIDRGNYDGHFWYFVFALLWVSQFIIAAEELSLAGCVTEWYVHQHETKFGALFRSMYRLIRYHLGTIAIGSLIIAIVQFIRVIFEYVARKLEEAAESSNTLVKKLVDFFVCCCRCCLWCLEKCLRFINKNAYIETALYGIDFFSGCYRAVNTIMANILTFGAINFVAFIVIFMMKLMVSLLVAAIAFAWIQDDDAVELKGVVVFVLAVLAWFIADAFAGIYSMTADTLLLVFAEDCAQTTGPHYASERLMKYVHSNTNEKEHSVTDKGGGAERNNTLVAKGTLKKKHKKEEGI